MRSKCGKELTDRTYHSEEGTTVRKVQRGRYYSTVKWVLSKKWLVGGGLTGDWGADLRRRRNLL